MYHVGEIRTEGIDMNSTMEISIQQADSSFGNESILHESALCHAGKQFRDLFDVRFLGCMSIDIRTGRWSEVELNRPSSYT